MSATRAIENGVLLTFRLFTGVRLALNVIGVVIPLFGHGWGQVNIYGLIAFSILDPALLFLYLSLPVLRRFLKGFYLPLGIVWATAGPIIVQHIGFVIANGMVSEIAMRLVAWQMIPVLFIPLVMVGWQYSMREVVLFCGLTGVLEFVPFLLLPTPLFSAPLIGVFFIQTITFMMVGNMIVNLMKVQRTQRAQLTGFNQRLAQYASTVEALTISRERNRLARELHDVLAHTLSGVAIELEGLRAVLRSDPEQSQALLNHSLQAVREGLTETRRALYELRAKPLEDLGLALAVRAMAESDSIRAGFAVELTIDTDFGDVPEAIQQSLYRVAQEALANVSEHAQAKLVKLELVREDGHVRLVISDDGQGFDPAAPNEMYQYGLLGMRERAEMTGGTLLLDSQAGLGTQITYIVVVPQNAGIGEGGGNE
ncbi:MAG: sensor histidine kinase [Anaerolineaceae bacterium]|nr:sensor histidine kinase [Anaerolineaceae bacterium]